MSSPLFQRSSPRGDLSGARPVFPRANQLEPGSYRIRRRQPARVRWIPWRSIPRRWPFPRCARRCASINPGVPGPKRCLRLPPPPFSSSLSDQAQACRTRGARPQDQRPPALPGAFRSADGPQWPCKQLRIRTIKLCTNHPTKAAITPYKIPKNTTTRSASPEPSWPRTAPERKPRTRSKARTVSFISSSGTNHKPTNSKDEIHSQSRRSVEKRRNFTAQSRPSRAAQAIQDRWRCCVSSTTLPASVAF